MIERTQLAPGYSISRLIHGGWQFSEGHRLSGASLDSALDVLVASAELGVTTFDCADIYTGVEELYGSFLKRWRTTSVAQPIQIHTKFVPDHGALAKMNDAYIDRIVERSLTRLGVERLDLVQYYWWRDDVPGMAAAASRLLELRDQGKIGLVASTNLSVHRLERLQASGVTMVSNQVQYSVLDRRPEGNMRGFAAETGLHLLAFGTLAGGFLSDRWLGAVPLDDAGNRSLVKYRLIIDEFGGWDAFQDLLKVLRSIADAHGTDIAVVALRFVLDQPAVAGAVVGATRLGQMERSAAVFGVTLTPEDHARIRAVTDEAPGPAGPVFGLERNRDGPHGRIMKYNLNED